MHIEYASKLNVSSIVKSLKGRSSRKLQQEFPSLKKRYLGNHFWSRGYFVSTVGLDEAMIRRYVKYQEHHDSK